MKSNSSSWTRRRAGMRAKSNGAMFEGIFTKICRLQGVVVTRIPDGCKRVAPQKLIQVKSPFDFVISYAGKTAVIDTKACERDCFNHSEITDHQVREMCAHEKVGGVGGYVIWLKNSDKVIFMPASTLFRLIEIEGSFSHEHPAVTVLGSGYDFDVKKIFAQLL